MADQLALPWLYSRVVHRFSIEGTNVPNLFGWRESAQQSATNKRIIWIPGDPGGALGPLSAARGPGGSPRSLATLLELFTVEITAHEPASPEVELSQYQAVRELYDAWYRAVYLEAHGTVAVLSQSWMNLRKERRYGAGLRVVCQIQSVVPDSALEVVTVENAAIDVEKLGETEQMEVSGDPT